MYNNEKRNYRNWFSEERITNNDIFCFKSPVTKPGDFRFVFNLNLLFWPSRENLSETNNYKQC